jgi:integrase
MQVGDYAQRTAGLKDRAGKPLEAATKATQLSAVRTFFRDCQEWEWIPRRFDPQRALATPRSIAALLGPDPRMIADEIWAKLMWAGLNLAEDDLQQSQAGNFYPLELVRAVTLAWLFSGQRSDEIARPRVGCIRWQHDEAEITGDSRQVLARDAVCLLDVPAHKTGTASTKPADPVLGQALDAWQAVRPAQPKFTDRRTGELVDLLFAFRARKVSTSYINNTVIPVLCRKAGVPAADVRGNITSHRARSTIASQPYNAKEPMTLFELQAWLGHRSPQSTQFYAKISAATLTRAYDDAGHFPATCGPSRSSLTATPSPPAPRRPASPGSTTTSATATAHIPSSNSARTAWPAQNATSTPRRAPARHRSSKPRTTCRRCGR